MKNHPLGFEIIIQQKKWFFLWNRFPSIISSTKVKHTYLHLIKSISRVSHVFSIQYSVFQYSNRIFFFPSQSFRRFIYFHFFLCPGIAFFFADARMTSNRHVAHHELYHSLNILLNNTRIKRSQFLFTINTTSRTKTKKKENEKEKKIEEIEAL